MKASLVAYSVKWPYKSKRLWLLTPLNSLTNQSVPGCLLR